MRHISLLLFLLLQVLPLAAQTFTFESADSQTIDGVTVSFAKGSGNNAPTFYSNGLRLYNKNTITVSGAALTQISLVFSKQGSKAYADMSANAGSLVSGGASASETDLKVDVWTGSAASVVFTLGDSGQRLIKQIVVGSSEINLPDDTTAVDPGETVLPDLDPSYTYGEPTRIVTPRDSFSNQAYAFVQNNIRVEVTSGAQRSNYFGCNAGQTITLTAARPIKGISAHAFLKKDFDATISSGNLYLVDTSDTITADPAIVITDVDATSLTISCLKQVRFYSVDVYFCENPSVDLPETGDYDFSFEPSSPADVAMQFDSLFYHDDSANLGYPCTYLYFEGPQYLMDLVVFSYADAATGIPAGTYTIDATYQSGTVMASPGGDEYMDYPSCVYADFDNEGYYNKAYYLDHGTLTVSQSGSGVAFVLDAYSHFGSHLTATFEGPLTNASDATALDAAEVRPAALKLLEDGKIVILRAGRRYAADGRLLE